MRLAIGITLYAMAQLPRWVDGLRSQQNLASFKCYFSNAPLDEQLVLAHLYKVVHLGEQTLRLRAADGRLIALPHAPCGIDGCARCLNQSGGYEFCWQDPRWTTQSCVPVAGRVFSGVSLATLKESLVDAFSVADTIARAGCIACSPEAQCPQLWYSLGGSREYLRTGCCEHCYDEAFAYAVPKQVGSLTKAGVRILLLRLQVVKASEKIQFAPSVFDEEIRNFLGNKPWPNLRGA